MTDSEQDYSEIVAAHDVTAREVESWAAESDTNMGQEALREEYIVCFAPGYPDPYQPHPNTLENTRRFVSEHRWNYTENKAARPVIKRRLVSDWQEVK